MSEVLERDVKILVDKKVQIKPIERERPFFNKGHDGAFMFTGCKERFTLPFITATGSFINIFERGEQEAFEKALYKKPGELSLYDRKSPFWAKFFVELGKTELTLDLNMPVHALQLKVLKANKDIIAPDWDSRKNKPSYKWAIIDQDYLFKEESKKADELKVAMELFFNMKNSNKKMSDVLRLMNKKVPKDVKKDWLETELTKALSQVEKTGNILNIKDFIEVASDPQITEKIFVMDAIEAKAIIATSGEFRDPDTNALLGKSLQSVVDHFSDPLYQEDKLIIEEKIKRSK